MMIRLFRGKVREGKQAEFMRALELLAPHIQTQSDMLAFYPGQPVGAKSDEFILVTVWKDKTGREKRSAQEWAREIIPAEVLPLVEEWHIQGYKSFGVLEPALKPLFQQYRFGT